MRHVIFGYGSLICPKSRATTAPTLVNVVAEPAIVANVERSWCVRVVTFAATASSSSRNSSNCNSRGAITATTTTTTAQQHCRIGYTPVGAQFKQGAECNGVLIHISEDELQRFDEREGKFYTRRRVVISDIRRYYDYCSDVTATATAAETTEDVKCSVCKEIFDMAANNNNININNNHNNNNDIAVWIYVPKENYASYANTSCPIIQSYIDIILRGCLSISNDFAKQFLLTTHGWYGCNSNDDDNKQIHDDDDDNNTAKQGVVRSDQCHHHIMWINDRSLPIYTRADIEYSMRHGQLIDQLIHQYHQYALQQRIDV